MDAEQARPPRLLLVEDDAISRSFMQVALQALPAEVDAVATAGEALAQHGAYAAWLIDARLPDGSGAELLQQLRSRSPSTVALAHTADISTEQHAVLRAAGFVDVLVKPLPATELQARVRARLPPDQVLDWDEAAALRALNGNPEHVTMLRKLFIAELPASLATLERAYTANDIAAMGTQLHKLRASCGFVGAQRLGHAVSVLQQSPASVESLNAFRQAAHALLN